MSDQTLTTLEREYRATNRWFLLSMIMIPLGAILPCIASAVAYQIAGDEWSAPIALSALFLPLIGVAGLLLLRGSRSRARRSMELAKLAKEWQLEFSAKATPHALDTMKLGALMLYSQYQNGVNQLDGHASGLPIIVLDYEYAQNFGSATASVRSTVVAYPHGFEKLPTFAIVPNSAAKQIATNLQANLIAVHDKPELSRGSSVVGNDPRLLSYLTPPVVNRLIQDPRLALAVENGRLMICRWNSIVPAAEYATFLAACHDLAQHLAAAGTRS